MSRRLEAHQTVTFGPALRRLRELRGWTLTSTATAVGMSISQLSSYERGRPMNVNMARGIALALPLTEDERAELLAVLPAPGVPTIDYSGRRTSASATRAAASLALAYFRAHPELSNGAETIVAHLEAVLEPAEGGAAR